MTNFFHRHRVAAVRILSDRFGSLVEVQSRPNPNALSDNGFVDHVFQSRHAASAGIQHIEVSATQSFAASLVVEHIPGNGVNAVRQHSRVKVEEAHRAGAIFIVRERARDVGTELVISWTPQRNTVYHNRAGLSIYRA